MEIPELRDYNKINRQTPYREALLRIRIRMDPFNFGLQDPIRVAKKSV